MGIFQNAPTWQRKNWGTSPITKDTLSIIADELRNNNILCAGDGSVLFGRAAHAWRIFGKSDYKIILSGSADVYGNYVDTNSLRPESFGCIADLSIIHLVSSSLPNIEAPVTYFCDNDRTVPNSARPFLHDISSVIENDIDTTIEINRIIKKSKITLSVKHAHGHQDLNKKKNELTSME